MQKYYIYKVPMRSVENLVYLIKHTQGFFLLLVLISIIAFVPLQESQNTIMSAIVGAVLERIREKGERDNDKQEEEKEKDLDTTESN